MVPLLLLTLLLGELVETSNNRPSAFLYLLGSLGKTIAAIQQSWASYILSALRWMALVALIVGLRSPSESANRVLCEAREWISLWLSIVGSMESGIRLSRKPGESPVHGPQEVLKNFVCATAIGDRIGLIAFAGRAYVGSPLTLDHEFLIQNIDLARAPSNPRTAQRLVPGSAQRSTDSEI